LNGLVRRRYDIGTLLNPLEKRQMCSVYVIGSGLTGISAAMALSGKGIPVTMLDAGIELEEGPAEVVRSLAARDKQDWDERSVNILRKDANASSRGVALKRIYGSDFPYRGMREHQPVQLVGAKMYRSLAKGGLSNVWGASILPFQETDILDWPISLKNLEPHYSAVLSFMCNSSREDGLNDLFSHYGECSQAFRMSRQASFFMDDLEKNRRALNGEKIFFGGSRLAATPGVSEDGKPCGYCGLCLYGCPYGNIYSSGDTLELLSNRRGFKYIGGILIDKLVETAEGVKVLGTTLSGEKKREFLGSQVFLAAGILSSTRIVLASMDAFEHTLKILHSDLFQIPFLRYRGVENVTTEELHTLTQIYLEILDEAIDRHTIHMQVYGYNDFYLAVMNKRLGYFAKFLRRVVESLLGRLLIIKGYLHSSISSDISVHLQRDGNLVLEGHPNEQARRAMRKVARKLFNNRHYFKALPLMMMARMDDPGTGNHSGGTFPMRTNPGEFETDVLGRPYGFKRVHIVDSSVFPTIPATTIAFSAMANAHRIASDFDSHTSATMESHNPGRESRI
jgi:choline dehydrogenase-like flavoprotein